MLQILKCFTFTLWLTDEKKNTYIGRKCAQSGKCFCFRLMADLYCRALNFSICHEQICLKVFKKKSGQNVKERFYDKCYFLHCFKILKKFVDPQFSLSNSLGIVSAEKQHPAFSIEIKLK